MAFYKDEKLQLFIDGASLYSTARALDLEIDFRKLLAEFRSRGRLVRANYYTTVFDGDDYINAGRSAFLSVHFGQ